MVQMLTRREHVDLSRYGHVIVDECHHVPAFSVERLLREFPARAITGLTATPQRRDGHHPIITMQCGPIRHTLSRSEQIETATRRVLITRDSGFDPNQLPVDPDIHEILSAVAADDARTRRIATDVVAELTEDRYPLVLTERREHLNAIAELLKAETDRIVVLHGGMGVKAQRRADAMLSSDGPRVVLATGRYIGEGFDDPRLDTLMLAMPIAWKGTMNAVRRSAAPTPRGQARDSGSSTTSTMPSRCCAACTQCSARTPATRPADARRCRRGELVAEIQRWPEAVVDAVAVVVEREGGGVVPHPELQAQRADAGVDQQRRAGVP